MKKGSRGRGRAEATEVGAVSLRRAGARPARALGALGRSGEPEEQAGRRLLPDDQDERTDLVYPRAR